MKKSELRQIIKEELQAVLKGKKPKSAFALAHADMEDEESGIKDKKFRYKKGEYEPKPGQNPIFEKDSTFTKEQVEEILREFGEVVKSKIPSKTVVENWINKKLKK